MDLAIDHAIARSKGQLLLPGFGIERQDYRFAAVMLIASQPFFG